MIRHSLWGLLGKSKRRVWVVLGRPGGLIAREPDSLSLRAHRGRRRCHPPAAPLFGRRRWACTPALEGQRRARSVKTSKRWSGGEAKIDCGWAASRSSTLQANKAPGPRLDAAVRCGARCVCGALPAAGSQCRQRQHRTGRAAQSRAALASAREPVPAGSARALAASLPPPARSREALRIPRALACAWLPARPLA